MEPDRDLSQLDEAIRHTRAGLKALEAARDGRERSGELYATHVHVAATELAHAIETAMSVALRQRPASARFPEQK